MEEALRVNMCYILVFGCSWVLPLRGSVLQTFMSIRVEGEGAKDTMDKKGASSPSSEGWRTINRHPCDPIPHLRKVCSTRAIARVYKELTVNLCSSKHLLFQDWAEDTPIGLQTHHTRPQVACGTEVPSLK